MITSQIMTRIHLKRMPSDHLALCGIRPHESFKLIHAVSQFTCLEKGSVCKICTCQPRWGLRFGAVQQLAETDLDVQHLWSQICIFRTTSAVSQLRRVSLVAFNHWRLFTSLGGIGSFAIGLGSVQIGLSERLSRFAGHRLSSFQPPSSTRL